MAKSTKYIPKEILREQSRRWYEMRIAAIQSRLADEIARANEIALANTKQQKRGDGRRVAAAKADLNKLYPRGVSDDVLTKQAENELRVVCEKQGRKGYSYETVRRALGRRK